jgi:glycosyltransferase involved in cell wall biosynthesis
MPTLLAPAFWKRRHAPKLFLDHLREELRNLVDPDWYRGEYLDRMQGVNPRDFFVDRGLSLGHMPNAFIRLDNDVVVPDGFWAPRSIGEFVLRSDWSKCVIGEMFSLAGYLERYADIRTAGVNPLAHFVHSGRYEGRQTAPVQGNVACTQEFNYETSVAEWITLSGTYSSKSVTSVSLYKSGELIGKARLGLPSVSDGESPDDNLHGFAYSAELTVKEAGEKLRVTGDKADGTQELLFEIELIPFEHPAYSLDVDTYVPKEGHGMVDVSSTESRPRSILILTHHLGIGGGQLYLQEILRGFTETDHCHVTVVSMVGGVLEEELRDRGFEVHIFDGPPPFSEMAYEQFMWAFDTLLSGRKFDVFLANTLGCFPHVDWCVRNGIHGLWAIHESYTRGGWARAAFGLAIDGYVVSRLEYALTHTRSLVFEAQGTLDIVMDGLATSNAEIVKYGVDIPESSLEWNPSRRHHDETGLRNVRLVSVGTFEPRKAQGLIVRSVDHLRSLGFTVHVDLVGFRPGEAYSESIRTVVDSLGLQHSVKLHEVTPHWEEFLSNADFFFMPSDVESMPQSMMIAMAHGVPAIGSRVFGIPELIHEGVTGFIHEPNDLNAIAAVILKAARLPEAEYRTMRKAARDFIIAEHEKSAYVDLFKKRLLASSP